METMIPDKECMNTVLLQAKVQESDVPYIEWFLRGIAQELSFGEETDFFDELTVEDIQKIETGREQIQQGMSISSQDLQKETREKYGNKMGYWSKKGLSQYTWLLAWTQWHFIGRYSKSLNLYCRTILKGRFLIYFDINEKDKSIEIVYFRSSKQESIE